MEEKLIEEVKGWVRDLVEVFVVLAVIIILSKIFLGANLLLPLVALGNLSIPRGS